MNLDVRILISGVILLSTLQAHSQPARDDTELLYNHIRQIRSGVKTTLEAQTYYVRGQIRVAPGLVDSYNAETGLCNVGIGEGSI